MINIYTLPVWFLPIDEYFELTFAVITLTISLFSYKLYTLGKQRQIKLFGTSFLFISISYFIQCICNSNIISFLENNSYISISAAAKHILLVMGIYSYIFFYILGLIIFTYMTFQIQSKKLFFFVLLVLLLSLILVYDKVFLFYILSILMILFIILFYMTQYFRQNNKKTALILVSFIILLLSAVAYLFSTENGRFYIEGHILELVAYLTMLINMIVIVKNAQKKG